MNFPNEKVEDIARDLLERRDQGRPIPVSSFEESVPDLETAYRIQLVLERLFVSTRDDKLIGYKLAATNAASREHLKVKAPFFGRLFQSMTAGDLI